MEEIENLQSNLKNRLNILGTEYSAIVSREKIQESFYATRGLYRWWF